MKKIIATVLATVMILSILATIAIVPATAAESEDGGDWAVYAEAKTYKNEDGEYLLEYDDPTKSVTNVAGYEYTEEGFRVSGECSKDTATTQRFQVVTKEKQNLKKGVSMTVEVSEFTAGGDWWFSFFIWDQPNLTQGDNSGVFGNGYVCLDRGPVIQNFISDQAFYDWTMQMHEPGSAEKPCTWNMMYDGGTAGHIHSTTPDENGVYTLTLDLQYDATTDFYSLYIHGVQVIPADVLNNYIHNRFADGFAYVGYGIHGSTTDCTTTATITKFNGETPTGTDKAEQTYNVEPVGPMIDTSTLDPNDPVLLFDSLNAKGEFEKIGEFTTIANGTATPKFDGSFTIYPMQYTAETYFIMSPESEYSYEASDYPYAAVLLRNFCNCAQTEGEEYNCYGDHFFSKIYYCADSVFSASMDCVYEVLPQTGDNYEDYYGNTYQLFIVDLSLFESWVGRINSFRVDIDYDDITLSDPDTNHFDFCYMGYFQTEEAAKNYTVNYVENYEECPHDGTKTVTPEVAPECTKTGDRETIRCDICNEYLVAPQKIGALGHDWKDSDPIAPTCTEYGREAGQECARCGINQSAAIEPLGHLKDYAADDEGHWIACQREDCDYREESEAHTMENGVCTVCGHGCPHAETTWTVSVEASCTAPGLKVETCNNCPATVNTEVIPATGHTEEVLPAVEPTCTEAGRTEGKKCSVCDAVIAVQTPIAALGHDEEVVAGKDATCTETGLTEGKVCKVCGETTVAQTETPVTAHTYDNDTDATCNVCGETRTIATEAPAPSTPNEGGDDKGGEDKGGCGSVIGLGAFAVIATVGLAGVVCFKKKED